MADQSQYLAQALQQMQGQPAINQPQGMSLQQMQDVAKQKAAFEAANPGQSYMAHGLQQAGQNVMNAPGNAMTGLQQLAQRFGGGQGQMPPY